MTNDDVTKKEFQTFAESVDRRLKRLARSFDHSDVPRLAIEKPSKFQSRLFWWVSGIFAAVVLVSEIFLTVLVVIKFSS